MSDVRSDTLGVEFSKAQARLRIILGRAQEIGPSGAFLVYRAEACLRRADVVAVTQDVPEMIRIYQEMMAFEE